MFPRHARTDHLRNEIQLLRFRETLLADLVASVPFFTALFARAAFLAAVGVRDPDSILLAVPVVLHLSLIHI